MRENFTQGSVRGEPGDRLSYRAALLVNAKSKGYIIIRYGKFEGIT